MFDVKKSGPAKSALILAAFGCVLLFAGPRTSADEATSPEHESAVQVAEQGFREFLGRALTGKMSKHYGLTSVQTADKAAIGAPFRLHAIIPDKVNACGEGKCRSTADFSEPMDTFFFPVLFNGQIKLLMTVDRFKGRAHFEIGSVGYRSLAREVASVLKRWPRREHTIELYVCPQAHSYGFAVADNPFPNLTLIDFTGADRIKYQHLSPLERAIQILKNKIAETLGRGV